MFVVVDDKIPYIREALARIADKVVYLPGKAITKDTIKDADALIVRTRTRCNRELLEGTNVRFIASATMGYDHIDTDYCRLAGITWTNCPGCNASSVGQYDKTVLIRLQMAGKLSPETATVGIVGVGNAGSAVARAILPLGVRVLFNDPPRMEKAVRPAGKTPADGRNGAWEENTATRNETNADAQENPTLPPPLFQPAKWSTLEELCTSCDAILFHVPLIYKGAHPTWHLADTTFFNNLKRRPVILNAGRGGIVDEEALLEAMDSGKVGEAVIDTWENEPAINRELLRRTFIGTPHIAGYSADGKSNATRMALDALCTHFHIHADFHIQPPMMTPHDYWNNTEASLRLYDPMADSNRLKSHPADFEYLRGNYPLRREK